MDEATARADEQTAAPETPEDVAILYSWANLPGAKYRDFSASRREYRAQQRARAAEAARQAELDAARDLEQAAQREVEEAQRVLEETRRAEEQAAADAQAEQQAEESLRRAEEKAELERQEALRRQQSAEDLRVRAERAREEMLDARKRAEEQAARYAEADAQYKERIEQRGRQELPGEVTDPYYYTGPVDPAYFAATPGVRTAQAARVSTERKAYVYPVHPGSDEFDSGTIVAYRQSRSSGEYALPGPRNNYAQNVPLEAVSFEPTPEIPPERVQSPTFTGSAGVNSDVAPGIDADYYDGGPTTRLFQSAPTTRYAEAPDTAPPDLHIRPATRMSSGEHDSFPSQIRPAPQARVSASERMQRPRPVFSEIDDERIIVPIGRRKDDRPGVPILREEVAAEPRRNVVPPPPDRQYSREDDGRLRPIRYEEDSLEEESGSSRMFIPSPRRRVLQVPEGSRTAPASPQPISRDGAAAIGRERSQAEDQARIAQDRFVQKQEGVSAEADAAVVSERESLLPPKSSVVDSWQPAHASEESRSRRRRPTLSSDPVARTVRQPRVNEAIAPEPVEALPQEMSPAPPAWLSAERPAAARPNSADADSMSESAEFASMHSLPRAVPRMPSQQSAPGTFAAFSTPNAELSPSSGLGARDDLSGFRDPARAANDTLQQSRERVASRWFALSGIIGADDVQAPSKEAPQRQAPIVSVLSISGGVGKTSIVATLGRALSSVGEKVLIADTNAHGMLPYYFGARDQRPGTVRTFTPPAGSKDAPVVLVNYDSDGRNFDDAAQARVLDDLYSRSQETQRVLLDVGVTSAWLAQTLASANQYVLVPVAPDMNSVLGTQAVERLFQDVKDADGKPVRPYYLLNQYDSSLPLHLDVREVLRQFLGDRLLPIMLHRTPAVSEALAEGMTVIDYAPGTPIADDYLNLAAWVRRLAEPGLSYTRPVRWSEQ